MSTLRELRLKLCMTQAELAQMAGVCRDTVNQIERGEQRPALRTIRKLAKALKVNPGDIEFPSIK